MAELRCEKVAKSYGERVVLRELDLLVEQGKLTAILGASGSGKTTLLRVIMGLARADTGRVLVGGAVVADAARRIDVAPDRRAVGYVAQEGALFPHLSVAQNVGFGLSRRERRRRARVDEMLELVGLDGSYRDRHPHELSGGEQRRVALARALAPRPQLVLLDEPLSPLDAALRAETREAVAHALSEEGATAVLVTHDQAEALSIGHEVAVLRQGALVQRAAPALVYREPVDFGVAQFVGEAIRLPAQARGAHVRCALGELELRQPAPEGPVEAMIRPEQLRLVEPALGDGGDAGGNGPAGSNGPADGHCAADGNGAADGHGAGNGHGAGDCALARVIDHVYYGPDTIVRLALEDEPTVLVKARTFEERLPRPGELVGLTVSGAVVAYPAGAAAGSDRDGVLPPMRLEPERSAR